MHDDSGLKKLLTLSWIYNVCQQLAGQDRLVRYMANTHWNMPLGARVVDVGCGTGITRNFLPQGVDYAGFDPNPEYIREAEKGAPGPGRFFVGVTADFLSHPPETFMSADMVMVNGVFHHLSDEESRQVLRLASRILKPDGKLVSIEPVWIPKHPWLSRCVMKRDRGQSIRSEDALTNLIQEEFKTVQTDVRKDLVRVPYIHIIVEATNV